jgi:hypothetical protein
MEIKHIIPFTDDDDANRIQEHSLWCGVIERLVLDLRAPLDHPLRIRQRAIRDFLLHIDFMREILEERCGFSESIAIGHFKQLEKLVKESQTELDTGIVKILPVRSWWAKRLIQ